MFRPGDRVRLAFDYARGHFEGAGRVVRASENCGPIVRPDGWKHNIGVGLSDVSSD